MPSLARAWSYHSSRSGRARKRPGVSKHHGTRSKRSGAQKRRDSRKRHDSRSKRSASARGPSQSRWVALRGHCHYACSQGEPRVHKRGARATRKSKKRWSRSRAARRRARLDDSKRGPARRHYARSAFTASGTSHSRASSPRSGRSYCSPYCTSAGRARTPSPSDSRASIDFSSICGGSSRRTCRRYHRRSRRPAHPPVSRGSIGRSAWRRGSRRAHRHSQRRRPGPRHCRARRSSSRRWW